MSEPTRVTIIPAKLTSRGREYAVTLGDEVLIEGTMHPFYDGARALLFRGITGKFEMWGPMASGELGCRMVGDIETCAGLVVSERSGEGLRVQRWRPREPGADAPQSAICSSPVPPAGRT